MSGLVTKTSKKGTGSGYANQGQNFKRFTASYSDWPIPFGCTLLVIECIGAGGGGGGSLNNAGSGSGAGGGGGGEGSPTGGSGGSGVVIIRYKFQ